MLDGSRSTVAIWALAAVLAVVAGWRLVGGGQGDPAPVRIDGPGGGVTAGGIGAGAAGSGRGTAGASGASGAEKTAYVHVAGAVRRPGLMRVEAGARVATALERAGGPTRRADLTLVNLAAPVHDGQQIVVPERGAAPAGSGSGAAGAARGLGAAGASARRVQLSTATLEQLDAIDGIGPTLAERILEYRDAHGGVRSIEELSEVEGIGEKRLETLRDALQP